MSIKDETIIEALLNTPTKTQAAEYAKCSRETIYQRLKNPEFMQKLAEATEQRRKATESQAVSLYEAACDVLHEVMTDMFHSTSDKLRAAQITLSTFKPK